eukprot:6200591-Pleurochrysis_carterae.AAC.2
MIVHDRTRTTRPRSSAQPQACRNTVQYHACTHACVPTFREAHANAPAPAHWRVSSLAVFVRAPFPAWVSA